MSTSTIRILRPAELRRDTPLTSIVDGFFIHNGVAAKTKEFYRRFAFVFNSPQTAENALARLWIRCPS